MSTRISSKSFFIGGLAAGAIAVMISLLLRSFAGGLFIPEIVSLTLKDNYTGTLQELSAAESELSAIVQMLPSG